MFLLLSGGWACDRVCYGNSGHPDIEKKEPMSFHPSTASYAKLCCSLLSLPQLERERGFEKTKGQAGGFSAGFVKQSLYGLTEVTSEGNLSGEGCLSH